MIINSIHIKGFRSFVDSGVLPLGQITVLIGPNNSGKSSLIKAIHLLQDSVRPDDIDVRLNFANSEVNLEVSGTLIGTTWDVVPDIEHLSSLSITLPQRTITAETRTTRRRFQLSPIQNTTKRNLIFPVLSDRKTRILDERINNENTHLLDTTTSTLPAKITQISNPNYWKSQKFNEACKRVLNLSLTNIPSPNGQQAGIYFPDDASLAITQLGEGVLSVALLLIYLVEAKNRIFLIEEPENDLHPSALKALLELIRESSRENQFIISTHSSIVARELCSEEKSILYKVSLKQGKMPFESVVTEVSSDAGERIAVLRDLGYEATDLYMWNGWIIFEESSAERIFRDFLIPNFAPKLAGFRTVSADGASNVPGCFQTLNRLYLFAHLTPAHKADTWVIVDGDAAGKEAIDNLTKKFPAVDSNHFIAVRNEAIEDYYPTRFGEKVLEIKQTRDKSDMRLKKMKLLDEVLAFILTDGAQATEEFRQSASELIDIVTRIQDAYLQRR